jgi:hypothetical protein
MRGRLFRDLVALVSTVTVALAGCTAPPTAVGPTTPSLPDDGAQDWDLSACMFTEALVRVNQTQLEMRMPPGFHARPESTQAGLALLVLFTASCQTGFGAPAARTPVPYASVYAPAAPPAGLVVPNVSPYYVKWATVIADETRRAQFQAWGLDAVGGTAFVDGVTTEGTMFSSTATIDGLGGFATTGVSTRAYQVPSIPIVEFMAAGDGRLARWTADVVTPTYLSGTGTIDLPADSWVAGLAGSTTVVGTINVGRWTAANTTVAVSP